MNLLINIITKYYHINIISKYYHINIIAKYYHINIIAKYYHILRFVFKGTYCSLKGT